MKMIKKVSSFRPHKSLIKTIIAVIAVIVITLFLLNSEIVQTVSNNDINYYIELKEELGYQLLFITIPLAIVQGFLTLFPIITILAIHILAFGWVQGLIFSFIGTFLGSLISFICVRYLFHDWSMRIWEKKKHKYKRLAKYIDLYGLWAIVILRSIPIMPSNIISLMAGLSPISFKHYVWSCVIGNLSMVWLLGIISSPVALTPVNLQLMITIYVIFCLCIVLRIIRIHYVHRHQKNDDIAAGPNEKLSL